MKKIIKNLIIGILSISAIMPFLVGCRSDKTTKPTENISYEDIEADLANENGYELWLRYKPITSGTYRGTVEKNASYIVSLAGDSEIVSSAKNELVRGLSGYLNRAVEIKDSCKSDGALLLGLPDDADISKLMSDNKITLDKKDGYTIRSLKFKGKKVTAILGNNENGLLYGAFKYLEMIGCTDSIENINYSDHPKIDYRVLNQWDKWDSGEGTATRYYNVGGSIYNWKTLPEIMDTRIEDFCRVCASVGINTVVINDVNSSTNYINTKYLDKVAAVASIFARYGIKMGISISFDSPVQLGELKTADPLNKNVINWWKNKTNEIYSAIPNFAGYLVKADSEGKPGPAKYKRTHADGANMFADALAPHGGIVMWRAFVYGDVAGSLSSDICNQGYEFFKGLDGKFKDNVVLQCKNGPRDFLPIEPVSPLFGKMPATNMGLEVEIKQEYTGQDSHLCYLTTMWKYYLETDMMVDGVEKGSATLSNILQGNVSDQKQTLIAGVANFGNIKSWTNGLLAAANWYSFGRLAWNPDESSDSITNSWIRLSYGNEEKVVSVMADILNGSWELYRDYTTPYAMGMTLSSKDHFNPDPSSRNNNGIICIDATGIGNNRNSTSTGNHTNATVQYWEELGKIYDNLETCPEELMCWFHHVPYNHVMKNGKTMYVNIMEGFDKAPAAVREMKAKFESISQYIDPARSKSILATFDKQVKEATNWSTTMKKYINSKADKALIEGGEAAVILQNVALNKNAYADQVRNAMTPDKAVDGLVNGTSRWGTEQTDECHYIFVDLGSVMNVNRVVLNWENYSMRYVIEVATELTNSNGSVESDWTVVAVGNGSRLAEKMYAKNITTELFETVPARYVRMRTLEKNSGLWNSLYEFEVYADNFRENTKAALRFVLDKASETTFTSCVQSSAEKINSALTNAIALLDSTEATDKQLFDAYTELVKSLDEMEFDNLAIGVCVRGSSVKDSKHPGGAADGNESTLWQAADGTGVTTLTVDFREAVNIKTIDILWGNAALEYTLEYMDEQGNFVALKTVTRDSSEKRDIITLDSQITAQVVKMTVTSRQQSMSLAEFAVYEN